MKQIKALNVAIVGGGPGCKAIMDMIFAKKLSQLRMKLIGVACTNPKAVGYRYAQKRGIYTTKNYRDLYNLKNLNMIIELTGRQGVADEISRTKPQDIRLMDHVAAHLFWDVFQIEENMIAERKKAEEELKESERRFRDILENTLEWVWETDANGKYTYASPIVEQLIGYKPKEVFEKHFYDLFHPEDREQLKKAAFEVFSKKEPFQEFMNRNVHKNGKTVWLSTSGVPILDKTGKLLGYRGADTDVTDRKRTEEALRESEERYRTVLEASPDPIVAYDMEGKVIYLNPAFTRVFGWTQEELLDKKMDYVPEENWPETQQMIDRVQAGKSFSGINSRRYTKQRKIVDVSISVATYLNRDGVPIGSVHTIRDITERKRLEAQLQQAQKLESIGTLAGGIAHDFNNLLMGIQGNISLMLMDMGSKSPHSERLKNIENQVQSGVRLTSHLLGYARKGRYEVKPIDLNQLVEEISDAFGRTKKEITIHRELAKNLFTVEADLGQIEQVFLNLFVNAADAMPGGGDLILKTMNTTHKDMKGKLYDPKPGNYVLLTVTDTGTGMYKKILDRIFDPFFTTKGIGRGTGLGLSSAYGIIKGHGGYIDVDSKRGRGTSFSIYLPASEKRARKAVRRADQLIKGTEIVLLIDDEEEIRQVGKELLETMGYQVLLAKDGKEAIKLYKKHRDDIEIVLLDMVMPNMGGGETYDTMKKINPEIKVLLFSGYSIDGEATEILERGCNGFLQKPFTMKKLSQSIREILD